MVDRRYGVHVPQLVGRVSTPKYGEDPNVSMSRIVGELDMAMRELQFFLRYLADANAAAQEGGGIVGVVGGGIDHGLLSGLSDDDHAQYLKEKTSGGLGSEIPIHTHTAGETGTLDHGTALTGLLDDDHPQYVAKATPFARGGTILAPTTTADVIVWRAPFSCTVVAVKGYRVGGSDTGTFINARLNGSSDHLASALELTSADTWIDGGSVQNTSYSTGDKLEVRITALGAPFPSQVSIQVDFTRA